MGNLEEGATWEYSFDGGDTWNDGDGTSFELPAGTYERGDVLVRQTDPAGNTSLVGSLPPVTIDLEIPAAPVAALATDTGVPGDGVTSDPTVQVAGLEDGTAWEYSLDGGETWLDGTGTSFELPAGSYEAGDIQVRQTDLAGNTSPVDTLPATTIDILPPAAPAAALATDTGTAGDGITSDATVNVGGLEPGASWEYSTDGGDTWLDGAGTSFELPAGEYETGDVLVRQTDLAGNTSQLGSLPAVTIDPSIPEAPTA
ncbi:hypothetical protein SCD90_15150, partial [Terrihabitans sp. PJ23]|nr:hypothetical protein [Terrihabitans sp. PJ23]